MSDKPKDNVRSGEKCQAESQRLAQPDGLLTSTHSEEHVEAQATARMPAPRESSDYPVTSKCKAEFAWNVNKYTNDYIRFADTKAGVVLTFSSALIGALYATGLHHRFAMTAPTLWRPETWFALMAFTLLFSGAGFAVAVVLPRPWNKQVAGLIFWDSILGHLSPEEFWKEYSAKSDTELEEHLIHHLFMLSRVCSAKYRLMNVAVWLSSIGAVLAAGLLILR